LDSLALTLGLTIALEYLVYLAWFRKQPVQLFLYAVLVNAATQPPANFAFRYLNLNLWLVELAVWLAEMLLLKFLLRISYREAAVLSLLANAVTTLTGIVLFGSGEQNSQP
jgi:hypothetical protein